MEKTEELLIAKYIQQDDELRKSVEEHRNLNPPWRISTRGST